MRFGSHIPVYGWWVFYETTQTQEFQDLPIEQRLGYGMQHGLGAAATTIGIDQLFFGGQAVHGFGWVRHAVQKGPAVAALIAPVAVSVVGAEVITSAYGKVIRDEPQDVQRGLWRSFAQALTGGFGTGSWSY